MGCLRNLANVFIAVHYITHCVYRTNFQRRHTALRYALYIFPQISNTVFLNFSTYTSYVLNLPKQRLVWVALASAKLVVTKLIFLNHITNFAEAMRWRVGLKIAAIPTSGIAGPTRLRSVEVCHFRSVLRRWGGGLDHSRHPHRRYRRAWLTGLADRQSGCETPSMGRGL